MSYSFTAKGDTRDAAKANVAAKFDEVIAGQASHVADREAVLAAAGSAIDLVHREPGEGEQILVNMHGSIGGTWSGSAIIDLTSVNFGITAYIAKKEA